MVLIDGGTGSELQRRGVPMSESAWSGVAVASHPKIVREVHQAYIEAGAGNGPIGVYPEVGYFAAPNWQFDESTTPEDLVGHARIWVEKGARVLGGCCGTTPDHIRTLRDALSELEAIARSSA